MSTVSLIITATADDCYYNSSSFDTSSVLHGLNGGTPVYGGVRFPGLTIPQGATITSATLRLLSWTAGGAASGSSWGNWYADAVDNAAAWSSSSRPDQITKTSASAPVQWNAVDQTVLRHDVRSIVQEIVNRAGWASGNALRIGGDPTGGGGGFAAFYDVGLGFPSLAPQLIVSYSTGTGGSSGRGDATGSSWLRRFGTGRANTSALVKRSSSSPLATAVADWAFGPQGASASGALGATVALSALSAAASGGAAAAGALGATVTVTPLGGSADAGSGDASASGAFGATITLSALGGSATGAAAAIGALGAQVTVTPLSAAASGDATATGAFGATVTLSALGGSATGAAAASGAFGATVTLSDIAGTASGGANAAGAFGAAVSLSPLSGSATGGAAASGAFGATVSLSPLSGTAAGGASASGDLGATVSVTPPGGVASVSATATGDLGGTVFVSPMGGTAAASDAWATGQIGGTVTLFALGGAATGGAEASGLLGATVTLGAMQGEAFELRPATAFRPAASLPARAKVVAGTPRPASLGGGNRNNRQAGSRPAQVNSRRR